MHTKYWLGLGLLLGTESAFFFYGQYLLREILLRDYEVRSMTIKMLFALAFASSSALSEGITLDIVEVLDEGSRNTFRAFNIYLTMLLVTLVIPFYALYLVFCRKKIKVTKNDWETRGIQKKVSRNGSWIFVLISWIMYVILFWFGLAKLKANIKGVHGIGGIIERVSIAGVLAMAILSGYGCVNLPCKSLPIFNKTTEKEVIDLKTSYLELIDILIENRTEVALIEAKSVFNQHDPSQKDTYTSSHNKDTDNRKPGLFKRFFSKIKYDQFSAVLTDKERLEVKKNEAEYVAKSMSSMYLLLQEKMAERRRIRNANTFKGKIHLLFVYFITIYLFWKTLTALVNIFVSRKDGVDSLSLTLDLINKKLKLTFNPALWSLRLSFIIVGIVIGMNMRNMVLEFTRMLNSFNNSTSFEITVLIFSAVLGSYIVSTLVMIQTSLPSKYRTIIQKAFGNIELLFYQKMFDYTYLTTALITALALYFSKNKTRPDNVLLI